MLMTQDPDDVDRAAVQIIHIFFKFFVREFTNRPCRAHQPIGLDRSNSDSMGRVG
jgi:hypothetical protein